MSEHKEHSGSQQKVEIVYGGGKTDHILLDTELLECIEEEAREKGSTVDEELSLILESAVE